MAKKQKKISLNADKVAQKVTDIAGGIHTHSSDHVKKYLTKRAKRAVGVKRFIGGWLVLVVLLFCATLVAYIRIQRSNLVQAPAPGGVYTEGVTGKVNSLNPLFGNGVVDDSAARLMFNGLLRYDEEGTLVPDLATSWKIDESRKNYTVDLRTDVTWHDQEPFGADDVVYTIKAIQDPLTRSVLYANWQGINVKATSEHQVVFELPAPFSPFLNALTVPILPSHLLKDEPPAQLRTASFNSAPVGTGPFLFHTLRAETANGGQLEMTKNENYYRGAPKIDKFVTRFFNESSNLVAALKNREITAAVDLNGAEVATFANDKSIRIDTIPLNSGVFAFMKTTAPQLGDTAVRRALVHAIDRQAFIDMFNTQYATLKTPLLVSQLAFDPEFRQVTNKAHAADLLETAGWKLQPDGSRVKDGQKLLLSFVTVDSPEYKQVAEELRLQWKAVGVELAVQFLTPEQLRQTALNAHDYDILLYGISMGHDPDVYAYWHSSQTKQGGLNLSQWSSATADTSLTIARTRFEDVLRVARYKTFLNEWRDQAPAVALYQPRATYVYHQNAHGFQSFPVSSIAERLTNVEDWTVNTRLVERTP